MANKQGTNQIVDSYIGDKLIEARYVGQTKYFDPYTTLTGTLPLSFNSRVAGALKNYRLYGDSDGAGVETENLWDNTDCIVCEGYAGSLQTAETRFVEYTLSGDRNSINIVVKTSDASVHILFPVDADTDYVISMNADVLWGVDGVIDNNLPISFSDTSRIVVYVNRNTAKVKSFHTNVGFSYIDITIPVGVYATTLTNIQLTKGTTFIPFGYKIPILNTSGVTENVLINDPYKTRYYINENGQETAQDSFNIYATETLDTSIGEYSFYFAEYGVNTTVRVHGYSNGVWQQQITTFANTHSATITKPEGINEIRISCSNGYTGRTLVKGSTPPDHYIPHRYESNYDLFIGSTKLGAEEYLDYGEQKVYKLKEVHKDTVTINGIEWDILGYDHDTVYKSDNTLAQHSVTIQTHDCISELQFDAREALFAFPEGLAAGTYHFTVSQQQWYAGDVGKTMQFTLTNAIPVDGVIMLGNTYNATMIGSTISVYASCSATTATETATISEGSDGTDLGSVGNAISGNTNSIQRALLGNNNYNESAIRQYLNSDGEAGTYWIPQNKWDRLPSWNAWAAGFLRRFNSDFVSVIGKVKKRTAKNTVLDGGGYIDTEEKVFLLSRTEVYAGANNSISEGTTYKYYSDYSDLSSAGTGADSNRTKYRNNVAKYWWLRSPGTGVAYDPFGVYSSGKVNIYYYAPNVGGVAPACCIVLDDINTNPYLQSLFYKPTDPPVPLPAINAYQGENTLSSTETLGEVSVKGRISEIT